MSDPVTNVEIEDVLSSIRRLVSEESRTETGSQKPAKPSDDRLVLTPALRVAEIDDTPNVAEDQAHTDAEELGEAPWKEPGATLFAAAAATPGANQEAKPEGGADLQETSMDDEDRFEQDGSDEAVAEYQDDPVDPDTTENTPEVISDEIVDGEEEEPAIRDARPLSDRIAELETRISETQDQWEPDGTGTDDYAGTEVETLEWQDHVEPTEESVVQEPLDPARYMDVAPDVVPEEEEGQEYLGALGSEDSFLDEESLRELVADIVREELQGALGERITRNVRKLVRREIHRALTAQELD